MSLSFKKIIGLSILSLSVLSLFLWASYPLWADSINTIVGEATRDLAGTWRWNTGRTINQTTTVLVPTSTTAVNAPLTMSLLLGCHDAVAGGFGCTSWDRVELLHLDANFDAPQRHGVITASANYVVTAAGGGGNWRQMVGVGAIGDISTESAIVATGQMLFNGNTQWDRARGTSQQALTDTLSRGTTLIAQLGTWSCTSAPVAATQATCTRAADASGRHVVTSFQACLYTATAAVVPVAQSWVVRDGASGAGTIFFNSAAGSGTVQGAQCHNSSPGYTRIGTAATAMTIEFGAAPPANVLQTVNMTGYTVP